MRLFTGLDIGKESLVAHGTALAALADNIANSNTTAFKAQRPEFADLFACGEGSLFGSAVASGNGVSVPEVTSVVKEGPVESTGRDLDVAVEGNGYFVTTDGVDTLYTRAGNFEVNSDGLLITKTGQQVLGYTDASPTTPVPLSVNISVQSAVPTTTVGYTGNLNTGAQIATVPPAGTSLKQIQAIATFSTNTEVIDSMGASHSITLYFFHTGPQTFQAQAYVAGEEIGQPVGTAAPIGSPATVNFIGTGLQAAGSTTTLTFAPSWANGSGVSNVSVDLSKFTGYASASNISSTNNNGYRAGAKINTKIDDAGNLLAVLDNGTEVTVGTLALAQFQNTGYLERRGSNLFLSSEKSGTAAFSRSGAMGMGSIATGSLEGSNVDLSDQFVNLIKYQRGYQAGSQVIRTIDEIVTTTLQIL